MFYPQSKLRGALLRAQFEAARYLFAGSLPAVLIDELGELAAVLAMAEPIGWVS